MKKDEAEIAWAGIARETEKNSPAKEATLADAMIIARLLDVSKDSVWEIIKGMKFTTYSELEMAVHYAFQVRPTGAKTLQEWDCQNSEF